MQWCRCINCQGDRKTGHDSTRGQVLARTCAWGRAERAFRRALGADPDNAAYRLRLAATLLGQKRHGDAREQLDAIAPEHLSVDEQARHATMRQVADAANDSLPCVSLEPEMTT